MGNNTRQNFAPSVWKDVAETKAGGGVIGTPGTPAVKEAWWEKGAAALAANTFPKMFDHLTSVEKVGKGGGKIGGNDAPSDHYSKIREAKTKGLESMNSQSSQLNKMKSDLIEKSRTETIGAIPKAAEWSDEKMNRYILSRPGSFKYHRDPEDKANYITKYGAKAGKGVPEEYLDGMSLNDMLKAQKMQTNKVESVSDAFESLESQEGYGKDIYSNPMPGWTPNVLRPTLPRGARYESDLDLKSESTGLFEPSSWMDWTKKEFYQ